MNIFRRVHIIERSACQLHNVRLSIRQSARISAGPIGGIFVKLDIEKLKMTLKSDKNIRHFHLDP